MFKSPSPPTQRKKWGDKERKKEINWPLPCNIASLLYCFCFSIQVHDWHHLERVHLNQKNSSNGCLFRVRFCPYLWEVGGRCLLTYFFICTLAIESMPKQYLKTLILVISICLGFNQLENCEASKLHEF